MLAEKRAELLAIRARRCESEHATSWLSLPVHEMAFELQHAALVRGEKSAERVDEGRERREQPVMIAELAVEIVAAMETHGCVKSRTHLASAPGERIERGELRYPEAAREAGTRQAQRSADGAHAGPCQARAYFFGPA